MALYQSLGAFNDGETQNWLDKQHSNYKEYGFGLWAVVLKENSEMIEKCRLTGRRIKLLLKENCFYSI